jgi:hypothetical protein
MVYCLSAVVAVTTTTTTTTNKKVKQSRYRPGVAQRVPGI